MSETFEYGEEGFGGEDFDEEDEMRKAILEAEANEVWQEEPGDEEDGVQPPISPLFGLLFSGGLPDIPRKDPDEKKENE